MQKLKQIKFFADKASAAFVAETETGKIYFWDTATCCVEACPARGTFEQVCGGISITGDKKISKEEFVAFARKNCLMPRTICEMIGAPYNFAFDFNEIEITRKRYEFEIASKKSELLANLIGTKWECAKYGAPRTWICLGEHESTGRVLLHRDGDKNHLITESLENLFNEKFYAQIV